MTFRFPIEDPAHSPTPVQPTPVVEEPFRRIPAWRLWLPLLCQAALIVAVPAQDAYTFVTGKPIVLQTAPVDPYDLMRGYSQTLGYEISNPATLKSLPGGQLFAQPYQGTVYLVLVAPDQADARPPKPWKPVRVSATLPQNLTANQVVLKGESDGWRIAYGLETYYMPEDQREQVNTAIGQVQRRTQQSFVVEAKVDSSGHAIPISLWVRDRNYRF